MSEIGVILLLMLFGLCRADEETTANELIGVCAGTSDGLQAQPAKYRYDFLRSRYTNCTYINGNLEITYLDDEKLTYDLSFFETVREVTGYVLIAFVYADYVPLTGLEIIRGNTLFTGRAGEERKYSLYIASNVLPNSKNVGLKELRFKSLREVVRGEVHFENNDQLCYHREDTVDWADVLGPNRQPKFQDGIYHIRNCTKILRGGVYISGNQALCHGESIEWKDIMPKPNVVYEWDSKQVRRVCSACHSSCTQETKGGGRRSLCWGSGPEYCQTLYRAPCSPQCDGRCYGEEPTDCCHSECAAGCTGPSNKQCRACRKFYDDGHCVPYCPPLTIYEPSEYRNVPNKNAKYTYGSICVTECPEHLLQDGSACVKTCPEDKLAQGRKCVPCNGPCPKRCPGLDSEFIDVLNIDNFRGCTLIDGNLRILKSTFERDPYRDLPPLDIAQLQILSTVKEITGYLTIQYLPDGVEDLSFLSSLQTIYGRYTLSGSQMAFSVLYSKLKSLKLPALKNIMSGGVMIFKNENLCYYNTVDWGELIKDAGAGTNYEKFVFLKENKDQALCQEQNHVCDPRCDGCWGPGNLQCQACKNYTFGQMCIESCSALPMIYDAGNMTCERCHPQCKTGCSGPGENQCEGGCLNFHDGPFCVEQCPESKFNDSNSICQLCHPSCVGGCTGPYHHRGQGGCNACSFALMSADGSFVDHCLVDETPGVYECPEGYYVMRPPKPGKDMAKCLKCHALCQSCDNPGLYCDKCVHAKHDGRCFAECPVQTYLAASAFGEKDCLPCHAQCKQGCNGSLSTDCNYCAIKKVETVVKVDDNSDKTKTIVNCTAECPATLPHVRYDPSTGEDICVAQLKSSRTNAIVGGTVGVAVLLAIVVVSLAVCWHRKVKSKENMLKIMMKGYDETVPITPTDIKPDLAKFRLIKESELRRGGIIGSGAFGTVYKGVWVPENENVKIPVAVKILQEGTSCNENKELLEEARIMASVDNPYCIRILCFCMTAQMMLVTQLMPLGCLLDYVRKNKDNIGSKVLLNWCTQIAKGMAYLEDRGIVHRDLAARNVLMQSTTHLKITDFGLAKLLDNEDEFKAVGGKMPIKWLALECIQQRVFTHKSDVWSYGVTVWEMFSYGQRPYENVRAREVPDLLAKGERLPQPSICTIDVYMLMIKCWMLDAKSRPSFRELADAFEKMARDPGRYLVIEGDALMRLPSQTVDAHDVLRSISVAMDGPEELVDAEEYLQPRSMSEATGDQACGVDKDLRTPLSSSLYDDRSSMGNSPAHESQMLLNPRREKKYGHLEDAYEAKRGRKGNSVLGRYSSDPCRQQRGHQYINDDVDGGFGRDDKLHGQFVDMAVDDEDYLQPTSSQPAHYMDVIDSDYHSMTLRPSMDESPPPDRALDNPEYYQSPEKRSLSPSDSDTLRSHEPHRTSPNLGSLSSCSDYSRSLSNNSDPFVVKQAPTPPQVLEYGRSKDPYARNGDPYRANGDPYRYSPSDMYQSVPEHGRGGSTSSYPDYPRRSGSQSSDQQPADYHRRLGSSQDNPDYRPRHGSQSNTLDHPYRSASRDNSLDYPDYRRKGSIGTGIDNPDYGYNRPVFDSLDHHPNSRRSASQSSDHHPDYRRSGSNSSDPFRANTPTESEPLRPRVNGYRHPPHDYYNDVNHKKQNGHVPYYGLYGNETTV